MRQSQGTQIRDLPVSSRSPTSPTDGPYGHVRCRHGHGRIKSIPAKVSQTIEVKKTYQICASAAQPPRNPSNRIHRVYRPWHRHGRIKLVPANVSRMWNTRNAYLGCDNTTQPLGNTSNHVHRVHRPIHRCDRTEIESVKVKIECINVKKPQEGKTTYLELMHTTQLPGCDSKHLHGVHIPCHQHSRMKIMTYKHQSNT